MAQIYPVCFKLPRRPLCKRNLLQYPTLSVFSYKVFKFLQPLLKFDSHYNKNTLFPQFFKKTVIYTNIASIMAKYNDLLAFVTYEKPSFLIVTETWLSSSIPDHLFSMGDYTIFRADRTRTRGGGVCIFIANHLLSELHVAQLSFDTGNIDSLVLRISCKNFSFVLSCVYRPPGTDLTSDHNLFLKLSDLVEAYENVFVFGDFNMPDLKWPLNPKLKCSQSSQLLVDFLMSTRMLQLVDQPTRIRRNQQPSTLDLVMISDANLLANLPDR